MMIDWDPTEGELFPLIPLLIIEATEDSSNPASICCPEVSINSTSNNRSDFILDETSLTKELLAVSINSTSNNRSDEKEGFFGKACTAVKFPLIPLLIIEATPQF